MFVNSDGAEDFSLQSVLRFLVAETQVFLSTWMDMYHLAFTSHTTLCVCTVQAPPCQSLLISVLHYPCWLVPSEVLAHCFILIFSLFFSALCV